MLSAWAVRSASETVLDPSFGGGVFLRAAAERLRVIGGHATQVYGVEMDDGAYAEGSAVAAAVGIPRGNLENRDFFAPARPGRFDVVLGNPPYIRFQRFSGSARARAAARAQEAGVELSPLASSWAPFVIHSAHLLASGGRMAMLVPNEIGQARYGRDVLAFLGASFARVTLVAFTARLFPSLDQDTLAVLACGRGQPGSDVRFARIDAIGDFHRAARAATPVDVGDVSRGARPLRIYELPPAMRNRYRALEAHPGVVRLDEVAHTTSGYVTGANRFFHLSPARAADLAIPDSSLSRGVFRARALSGLTFADRDWQSAARSGSAGWLLTPAEPLEPETRAYLRTGEDADIHQGYKTGSRTPWYAVPRVQRPDMLMAAMASESHALVLNRAQAAPANTLHAVVLRQRTHGDGGPGDATPAVAAAVAVAWLTSLSRLSRELEARVLGGGMLKIEPGEAGRVLLPGVDRALPRDVLGVAARIDRQLRAGRHEAARAEADALMLRGALDLTPEDVALTAEAVRLLRNLRRRSPAGR